MIETLRISYRVFIPKGQRVKWVGLIAIALVVAAAETVTALLIFRVLGFATDPDPASDSINVGLGLSLTLSPLLALTGLVFVIRGLLSVFSQYAQNRVVQNAGAAVASLIHRRYLLAPYSFHLSRSSSESLRTVLWSVDQATNNALNPIISIVSQGIISATLFGLLVGIAPTLSIAAVAVLALGLGLVLAAVQPRLGRIGKVTEDVVNDLIVSVRDSFDSVRDIKVYRAETYFDGRFRRHRNVLAKLRNSKALFDQIPTTALEYMVVIGLLVLIGIAYRNESFGDFVPVLGAFGYATLRIVPSVNKIVAAVNRVKYGQQAVLNVENDILAAVPEEAPHPLLDVAQGPLFSQSIELRQISFSYPGSETPAVDAVDLFVERGEMLAIAGGSGSGKSTLVDVILGLLEPDSGDIYIDGSAQLPEGWHRKVGIVSQSVVLLDASVRENVAFGDGSETDEVQVLEALAKAHLTEWLASLPNGLDTMVGESGKLLSGGERQRVAIARSLYRQPDLLILDEATSALDGATEASLLENLVELSGELTTIIVSHRLAPIRAADRVAMMDDGRITAVGTYEELAAEGSEFRNLVGKVTEDAERDKCLPAFLLAGAMRSGTTSWYRYLGDHPEIAMMPKELEFFTEHFAEGLDWYQARCREAGEGRLVGEATADYLARGSAMNRIASVLPDVRLIVTLREPVERAWSHYGLLSARGREARSFSEAVDEEMAILESQGPDAGGVFYLYHGLYDVHLERAYRLFNRPQVHVSIFERMVKHPETEYRAACEFLEVDSSFMPQRLGEQVNAFVTFRSLRVRQLSHRMPQPLGRIVARVNTRTNAPPPTLPDGVRGRLRAFYAPRIERVSDLLGDDLAEWRHEA